MVPHLLDDQGVDGYELPHAFADPFVWLFSQVDRSAEVISG
jgi:hypothetical protein